MGDRTGETYRLGDRIESKLVEAAPVAGAVRRAEWRRRRVCSTVAWSAVPPRPALLASQIGGRGFAAGFGSMVMFSKR